MRARLHFHKPKLVFFAIYTLVFLILSQLALYVMPLIISLIIAVVMKPLYDYFRRKFAFRSTFAATVITVFIFGIALAIVGFLLYLILLQAVKLFETYGYLVEDYVNSPELFNNLRDALMSGNLLGTVTDIASTLFRVIPLVIIFVVITFSLTVFFLHRLTSLRDAILDRVGDARREILSKVFSNAYLLVRRFIRSYMVLYVITFIEAAFIFYLTGVEYPLPFAFITAVADILPILGPGTVYLPFAVIFILQKNYLAGITILVFFLLTAILRQIMEPKIVSDSVKVHPLIVMTGIYLSIAAMNLWLLFYVVLLFLLYKVLSVSGVFDSSKPTE